MELWEVANFTTDEHPIHVHLATTRVHSRRPFMAALCGGMHRVPAYGIRYAPPINRYAYGRASGPRPWEVGDKDTVWAPPGTITRLLVRAGRRSRSAALIPDATFIVPSSVEAGAPGMTLAAERMPMSMHAVNTGPLGEDEVAAHRAATLPQGGHPAGAHGAMGHTVPGAGRIGAALLGHAGHAHRARSEPEVPRTNGAMDVAHVGRPCVARWHCRGDVPARP